MRLRVDFGLHGARREVNWWQPIEDFPKLFRFQGKKWEWFMYDKDKSGHVDYVLTFSEIASYDPNWHATMDDFEDRFGHQIGVKCECGAVYTSFPNFHMLYCPMWRKW